MEDWPVIFYICHSIQPLAEGGLKWAECRPITELAGYRAASARHRVLLFTPFGCSSNSIQPILSRLRRGAGYYDKCYFIGRTPCSRVHDAV